VSAGSASGELRTRRQLREATSLSCISLSCGPTSWGMDEKDALDRLDPPDEAVSPEDQMRSCHLRYRSLNLVTV
jgi:hypothetical protein